MVKHGVSLRLVDLLHNGVSQLLALCGTKWQIAFVLCFAAFG
jgi:hypothetical protein